MGSLRALGGPDLVDPRCRLLLNSVLITTCYASYILITAISTGTRVKHIFQNRTKNGRLISLSQFIFFARGLVERPLLAAPHFLAPISQLLPR
jgi:hypothetical protein